MSTKGWTGNAAIKVTKCKNKMMLGGYGVAAKGKFY